MTVPFLDLISQQAEVADEVITAWREQLSSASFVGGTEVDAFESEYADYVGVTHCVGVGNGTDALELAYRAAGIAAGDEVIIPANTFIATAEAASRIGAVPVFVDVGADDLLMDPAAVEAAMTPRTRGIVPVHLFGRTADMGSIGAVAERHGVAVIEDAAQSQGASSVDGRAGSMGLVSATSFYPGKNLGAAGDAGAVLTDDDDVARTVRMMATHGSATKYVHDVVGINSRLDATQAVVLRAKLRLLDGWNAARREAAARYDELLGEIPGVGLPVSRPGNTDVWHIYAVQVADRDRVADALRGAGIGVGIHYPVPVHLSGAYAHLGYSRGSFPVAEHAADVLLSLPMFPHLTRAQQERVANELARALS